MLTVYMLQSALIISYLVQCQSACALVRHHLSSGSVCDPETNKWYRVSDVTFIVTSNNPSYVKLHSSFLKHFAVIQWDQYRLVSTLIWYKNIIEIV